MNRAAGSPCNPYRRYQSGAALMVFMLLIIIASSYYLLTSVNTKIRRTILDNQTLEAMTRAKQALIGYAVSYPDRISDTDGPGYFPCPDKDNDGDAEGSCSLAGANRTVGRFPHETLEMEELYDGSGQKLWYAISENFRNNPKTIPLNMDSPATASLTIDANTDIAAVIIAPGFPVSGQSRDPAETDITLEIANYLEGDNNDLDNDYVTTLGPAFFQGSDGEYDAIENGNLVYNDQVIFITRQELMSAVKKRVIGEVAEKLNLYRGDFSAFPWLSPFSDPINSSFKSQLGQYEGHLPFHWSGDPSGNTSPFNTSFTVTWNGITNSTINKIDNPPHAQTVTDDCLENLTCTDPDFGGNTSLFINNGTCAWIDKVSVSCTGSTSQSDPPRTRTYTFNLNYSGTETINDPSATSLRTRDVTLTGALPANPAIAIQIDDVQGAVMTGTGTLEIDADTTGTITVQGIQYDLDVDDIELPEWFVKNEWHHYFFIAYPTSEPLPGAATTCTNGTDCLVLNGLPGTNDNIRALSVFADETSDTTLDGTCTTVAQFTQDRATGLINAYYEGENCSQGDGVFETGTTTGTFNDTPDVILTN